MAFISKLKNMKKELRAILVYGDTQTLELMQACLLSFCNPYQLKLIGDSCKTKIKFGFAGLDGCQYLFYLISILCICNGLAILYTILINNLEWRLRLFRIYWAQCIAIGTLIYVCKVYMPTQYYLSYLIQFIFACYTLWKLNKEYIFSFIKRGKDGR